MTEHPVVMPRRALALVAAYRSGNRESYATILDEVNGPDRAAELILCLVKWVDRALRDPTDDPEEWISTALRDLSMVEGDEEPPNS